MSDAYAKVYAYESQMVRALGTSSTYKRNMFHEYREEPIEPFPHIFANDPRLLKVKDGISRHSLRDEWTPNVDDFGRVYGNGLRSNLHGLRYINGLPDSPATYPLFDNTFLREQKGMKNHFVAKWHENVFRAIPYLFFSDLEPQPIKLRTGSSSMMPHYVKDITEKKKLLQHALDNGEKAGNLVLKGEAGRAWRDYYIGGAYHTVYRRQSSDAVEFDPKTGEFTAKKRPRADLLFAVSGGRKGTFEPNDRRIVGQDFWVPEGFFRERNRTAMGGPLGLNGNLMPVAQAVRKKIYSQYAYSYHHTTRTSQEEDIRKWKFVIPADVSNHDWFWPTWMVTDVWADELLSMGYSEWWVALYRLRMTLPNYVTDVGPNEGNLLIGDWFNPANKGGLPSGNAFTDVDGTMLMTCVYFIIQVEHTYPELIPQLQTVEGAKRVLDAYLRGTLPICLKDKSDDALLGWKDSFHVGRAQKLLQLMKDSDEGKDVTISPYMKVTYEHGGAFLGSVLLFPKSMDMSQVTLIGNNTSLFVNRFSPEYGVQSGVSDRTKVRRPYGGLAYDSIVQNYGQCPMYKESLDVQEFYWRKEFGESLDGYLKKWRDADEQKLHDDMRARSLQIPELTPIDLEVLASPDKLDYKYLPEDVSSSVRETLLNGLSVDVAERYLERVLP